MMTQERSPLRGIVAFLTLLPAIMFAGSQLVATPDLETWLAYHTQGFARPDAFDGVEGISPVFSSVFGVTSLLAAYLVVSYKSQYLLPLAVGPLLTTVVYLAEYGVTDPSWFSLLALLAIGMLVGSSVTAMWVVISRIRHRTKACSRAVTSGLILLASSLTAC